VLSYTSMTCQSPVCRHQRMLVYRLPPGSSNKNHGTHITVKHCRERKLII
jgi:hypothetical protein